MRHFDLVTRYLNRIRAIYRGVSDHHPSGEEYFDDVVAFFVQCHHMYDWLCTAKDANVTRATVANFIDSNEELRVCADICNQAKHCILRSTRTESGISQLSAFDLRISGSSLVGPPIFMSKYRVYCGDKEYDALELAERCHALWASFLEDLATKSPARRT